MNGLGKLYFLFLSASCCKITNQLPAWLLLVPTWTIDQSEGGIDVTSSSVFTARRPTDTLSTLFHLNIRSSSTVDVCIVYFPCNVFSSKNAD